MKCKSLASLMLVLPMSAAISASAGSWSTQATLASNAYSGTIALDTVRQHDQRLVPERGAERHVD